MSQRLSALVAVLAFAVASTMTTSTGDAAEPAAPQLPILFVHGFMGSGQQFESQALRFASNGYDPARIDTFEHDSLAWPDSRDAVWAGIDTKVDALTASSGEGQVILVGHSQGTGVVQGYLNSSPTRAARVSAYINIDGGAGGTVPPSVRALGIWGEGDPSREIPGGTNVQFADQSHTEVVNSPESFAAMYRFVTGSDPAFGEVVRESGDVTVSGRAILFPENAGAHDATLTIYRIDPTTGARTSGPVATQALSGNGDIGPFTLRTDTAYEFEIARPSSGFHHVYPQTFVRSSRWFRLLTSEPGGLADSFWEPSSATQNISVLRNEEWWGDQGARDDVLAINGESVLTAHNSPRSNRTIGIFLHDADSDGISGSVPDPAPTGLPFLTGIDLVIPAGDGTTSVRATPRNGTSPEAVCLPALASQNDRMSVQFNSYHHLLNPDGSAAAPQPDPTCAEPAEFRGPTTTVPGTTTTAPSHGGTGTGGDAPTATAVAAHPTYTG